jgi:Zn-dependent protease with chaperone function
VTRWGALLVVLVAAGCRGPSPRQALDRTADDFARERIVRVGETLLSGAGVHWRLTPRDEVGAWAWPDGRIEVSRVLLDRLDDDELAAALAHELGHLLDRGHLAAAPRALAGDGGDLEHRADRIGCVLLSSRGVSGEAMIRMLGKLAAATRDRDGALAARIAAAPEACTPVPGPR